VLALGALSSGIRAELLLELRRFVCRGSVSGERGLDQQRRHEWPGGRRAGDLIIGKDQGSAIGTLVERQTRMTRLLHMPQRDGDTLHAALTIPMDELPAPPAKTR
jgi:IS30 family transposase